MHDPVAASRRRFLTHMHRIRVITLDLDDTLWAIGPVIARAEKVLWQWYAEHYPRITERWDRAAIDALRADIVRQHADRAHDLRFLRRTVMAHMAAAAGYDTGLVDDAFAVFDAERNKVDLFPDVLPALKRLSGEFRLVALTNGNADIARVGIGDLFADSVAAADIGAAKPDARIFAAACRRLQAAPDEVLHVGDHPQLDVHGARSAGLRTAWMNRAAQTWPQELPAPDAEVAHLGELADMLDAGRAAAG